MPDTKKSKFDDFDFHQAASEINNNLPTYEPKNFEGNLDLGSKTLNNGVPASLIGDPNSEEYLNELKAQRQGTLDKFANGTLKALNSAVVGTIGNTAGVVHGLSDMANGQSFFDNGTFKFMDEWDEAVKETLPLYRSQQEQNGSLGNRVLDQDFLFGDLFEGVGFAASSLIPGIGWAKLGKLGRTALLASKTAKLNKLATASNMASKEFLALNKFVDVANKTIGNASNLGAATFGRIYESRLEAKGVYDEVYNKSYDKKIQELRGIGLSDDEVIMQADQYAEKQATDARNFTFGANMLLAIPDMWQMGKIFGNGAAKVLTVNKIIQNSTTGLFEEASQKASKGLLSKAGKVLASDKLQTAAIESLEEGIQYNISETSKKLAEKDFDFNLMNYSSEFFNQSIKNMSSPEFIASALAGGIIGGGMSMLHNDTNKVTKDIKDQNTAQAVQNLNEYAPLLRKVQNAQDNVNKYTQLEKEKTEVIDKINNPSTTEEEKIKARAYYRQLDNLQFAQAVQVHTEAGTLDSFLDEIELFGTSTKNQLKEDFGIETFEYNEDGSEITPKEIADKKIKRAKSLAASYQFINSNYTNLSQASRNELYNITSSINYNDEKLNVISNKATELELEKSNAEMMQKPFNPDKAVKLENLKKEKEYVSNIQEQLGKRHEELRNGKAEDREVKQPIVETEVPKEEVKETPILETITSEPTSKYKGKEIDIIENKNGRVSFKVKGNNVLIKLSKEEFDKQVLGKTSNKQEVQIPNVSKENKEASLTLPNTVNEVSSNEYDVSDLIINDTKQANTKLLPIERKDLGTQSFFNSPLFFSDNGSVDKRNEILSDPNWSTKFRIVANKEYAKNKSKATKNYSKGKVNIYTNGGENALDLTIEYNEGSLENPNWVSFGALPYSGMLRDSSGKPYDFSKMTYKEFTEKFYIAKITDKNGVEQTIEFTPNQFNVLTIQQGIFNEFETLVKQKYAESSQDKMLLSNDIITPTLSYFVNNGEVLLSELGTIPSFNDSKILVISDGKINKELTNTDKRITIPEYLTDTYGTNNKTFINVELTNGVTFWTVAFTKGDNKKLESEVSSILSDLAINYNSTEANIENDSKINDVIKELNSKVFIQTNLKNYLNFRAFSLENNKGYKIKVQLKTEDGSKYIDIFNPETTLKEDGSKLTKEELSKYFTYDNLSKLINSGFEEYNIDINPNSFVSNYTKGNPKIEDLVIPISNIEYNIKFQYNTENLSTLKTDTVLDKNNVEQSEIEKIEKENEEEKLKAIARRNNKDTGFSKVLNDEVLPLKGNEEVYKKYNLLNNEGKIKSVDPNSKSIKNWVRVNNNSPYYNFIIKQASDGKYKIFIKNKVLYSKENLNNEKVSVEYLENYSNKIKDQFNLNVVIEPIFDNEGNGVKGLIKNNTIYLNPTLATKDTPIHEVIHPFVELIKQDNKPLYKNLILELKKSDIGKRIITLVNSKYNDLTEEEILDESLVTLMGYYSSGVISRESKSFLEAIKAFFKKISNYIKSIFNKDLDIVNLSSTSTIQDLSDIIETSKINLNTVNTKPKESKLDLLSSEDSNKLINTIGAKVVQRITEKPTKENLSSLINDIIEQTRLENKASNINADSIEDTTEKLSYIKRRSTISTALTIDYNVEAIKKSITNDVLKMFFIEEETYSNEDDVVQNVNEEADIRDYEEGVENSGGWNNVSPEIRNFIYYNTYTYVDNAGNIITEAVDGLQVYKQIQNALADQQPDNFISILEGLAKYNIQLKSILDNFKIKTGLDNEGVQTVEQFNFYNKFFKTFENTKLEYVQVFEKDSKLVVSSSNKSTNVGRLFNKWKTNFVVNKDTLKSSADKLQKVINNIGSEVLINPNDIVNELYNSLSGLGIEISKPYLEYSFIQESPLAIFKNQGVLKLDYETINKIINVIKKEEDLFEKSGKKSNASMLYKIAEADSIFRNDNIEDTYRDARGKLRNSYTRQNLVTKKISEWKNKIKDSFFVKDILEDKNNYYHYNYLFNNKLYNNIEQIQEVFRNADLSLIGDFRQGNEKFTTRNITSEAFSKMQLALFKNSTSPKDIVDNSSFPYDARIDTRQQFAFIDFGKISDKNTEMALRLPIDNRFSKDGKFTDWFVDQLYNTIFLQEYTKLKSYDNKGKLYYSKTEPLYLNDSILKEIKTGNAWSNLSILNNNILEEYSAKYNKPEYLELKGLLTVEDLSTKKELIKKYLKESFDNSFKEYLAVLKEQSIIGEKNDITELGNMYANNFLLRTSFQQLVKGDLGISKNNEDDIKRNGRVTAYGESGTDFNKNTDTKYKVLYLTDATRYKVKEDNNFRNATTEEVEQYKKGNSALNIIKLDSDDAGARMTVKHLINTLQRLGRLNSKTLAVLNKLDSGEELSKSESALIDLIPMKGVHGGVNTYLKMSQFTLTKQFTSVKDKDGNWVARRGKEQLHNLRELMERNNVGLAIPKSGSKSISKPLFNQEELYTSSEYDVNNNVEDIDWSDWRLQVENESGKIQISQPVQIIQMIDGSSKIDQSTKDKLQDLYVEQRTDDFNDALNIASGNTGYGKQLLIDKFQENAINSASDDNTLEYLSGENNEFTYNPNLGHITFMFENYYTSHFNKNVLAQKIPGYKCTLVPATGIQIIRDTKTGEVILSDVYEANKKDFNTKQYQNSDLRIHSGISPYAECLMTKAQANNLGLNIGDSITEDVFKMIGTRLPCQGYSSMIPLKVVDFLPEFYGSSIIVPEEVVYIAGSDYDVDSLFIMRKEAYKTKEGVVRYYTYDEKDNELRWQDYKQYLLNSNKNIKNKLKESDNYQEVLKAFGYPSTKEEFLAKEKELGKLINSKYAVTNELVNIYEEILTDPNLLEELQKPVDNADLDVIGKTIYFDLQNQGSKLNYFHNSDNALKKHFELATQGKRDVGSAANGNSVSSFFKKHKVQLNDSYHFMFNGKEITNVYEDNVIDFDFIYKENGKPLLDAEGLPLTSEIKQVAKQDVHSGLMSITVDNGKDPVCFMLNLDPANVSIASTMIHLGIGGKGFIATFMNSNPVKTGRIKEDYAKMNPSEAFEVNKEMLIKSMMGKATAKENYSIALLYETLSSISLTTANISKLLASNKGVGSTFEDIDSIKDAYEKLIKQEKDQISPFKNISNVIKDNKNISFNLKAINTIDNEILNKEFLGRSEFIKNVREFLKDITYTNDIQLDKDFSGYLISKILKHNRNVDFEQLSKLCLPKINGKTNNESIVSDYYKLMTKKDNDGNYKYPEFRNNILIKFLTVEKGNKTKPELLYFNQSIKLNGKTLEKLTDGYRELLESENKDVKDFAKNMFYYLIVKDNMKFTINSFGRLLAPEMFKKLSSELKVAVDGVIEVNDEKLQSITGKTFNELGSEFLETYIRWVGNADNLINFTKKRLSKANVNVKEQNLGLILTKDSISDFDYPEYMKYTGKLYRLVDKFDSEAAYKQISYIGLPIMSPYHLDINTNESLFNNSFQYIENKDLESAEDYNPSIETITRYIDNSNAESPVEYQQEDIVEQTDSIFGIVNNNTEDFELQEPYDSYINEEPKEISLNYIKPSNILQPTTDQNIDTLVSKFYGYLNKFEKEKLATKHFPKLNSAEDIIKEFNKPLVKKMYNNDITEYLDYLRKCRL